MTALFKIGIEDGLSLGHLGGIGRYTRLLYDNLSSGSLAQLVLFRKDFLKPLPRKIRRLVYIFWANIYLPLLAHKYKLDIIHFTNYLVPMIQPKKTAYVVTIHDLAVWRVPDTFPPTYLLYLRRVITSAIQRASLILAVSQSVKQEICAHFGIDQERVVVVGNSSPLFNCPPTPEPKQLTRSHSPHLLSVGRIELRKNYVVLLDALLTLSQAGYRCYLTIVGSLGYGHEHVLDFIRRNNMAHAVQIRSNVSDNELRMLYEGADLFVYPSLYEGFGIPVLEAMSFGLPVVASDIQTNHELLGHAGIFFKPTNSQELAELIYLVLKTPKLYTQLSKLGKERASLWSPERFVERHLEAYKRAFMSL